MAKAQKLLMPIICECLLANSLLPLYCEVLLVSSLLGHSCRASVRVDNILNSTRARLMPWSVALAQSEAAPVETRPFLLSRPKNNLFLWLHGHEGPLTRQAQKVAFVNFNFALYRKFRRTEIGNAFAKCSQIFLFRVDVRTYGLPNLQGIQKSTANSLTVFLDFGL